MFEKVNPSHPDKIADRIAGAVVDLDALMQAGVKLKQGFAGTGYSDQVRFFPDFGSRIYFMKEE